jgi:hypothetical protein
VPLTAETTPAVVTADIQEGSTAAIVGPTDAAAPSASDIQPGPTPALSTVTNAAPLVVNANAAPPASVIVPVTTNPMQPANIAVPQQVVTTNPAPPTNAANNTGGKWFAVTRGHQVGVFHSWFVIILCRAFLVFIACYRLAVAPLVNGVPGSVYSKHPSEAVARLAFNEACAAGNVHPYNG